MADTMMLNFNNRYNNNGNANSERGTPNGCNGECHKNKFSNYESEDSIPQSSYNDITYEIPSPTRTYRRKKIKEHTEDFIGNSTLHGFHYCFDKGYRFRRILWILIVMGSIGMLLQKLFEAGQKYFDRPFTSTSTVINPESIEFPAVSFCNINDYRWSKMEGTTFLSIIKGKLGFDALTGPEYAKASKQANHRLDDMLHECKINFMLDAHRAPERCSSANFSVFYQSQGEKCFTINSGVKGSHFTDVKEGGRSKSLEMTINLEHYEYFDKADAGVRLIIHDQDETPIRFSGVALPPGYTSYVEVRKTETLNLEKPYKTACDYKDLEYFEHYSENACWLEKLTKHVTSRCHCKDGFMPGNAIVCSVQELINCTWPQWEAFNHIPREQLDCPISCRVVDYDTVISSSQFPSNREADKLAKKFGIQGSKSETRRFVRDNFLKIVIYFEKLTYKRVTQTPSYDTMILLGDIGGQLGLFLGTSILTYLEFFDYLAMVIYSKYFEIVKIK